MAVSMSGLLYKVGDKGLVKRWKARWFEVVQTSMFYYKNRGEPVIGAIDLATATEILPSTMTKGKSSYGFEVRRSKTIRTPERTWYLFSESQSEQEAWISHLREVIQSFQTVHPPTTPKSNLSLSATSSPILRVPTAAEREAARQTVANQSSPSPSSQSDDFASQHDAFRSNSSELPPPTPSKPSLGPPKMPAKLAPLKKSPAPPTVPPKAHFNTVGSKKAPPMPRPYNANPSSEPAVENSDAAPDSSSGTQTAPPFQQRPRMPKAPISTGVKKAPPKMPARPPVPAKDDSSQTTTARRGSYRASTGDIGSHPNFPRNNNIPSQQSNPNLANSPSSVAVTSSPVSKPPSQAVVGPGNPEKRTKTANEILSTEKYYVDCLVSLQNDFMTPLIEAARSGEGNYSEADVRSMFSSVLPMIIPVNEELLKGLEKRLATWDVNSTVIGDVFVNIGPFLKMYFDYSKNYQAAIETYNKLKVDEKFSQKLIALKDRSKVKLGLEHLLIMPVQRIPRYTLLLGELLRETGSDHPDRAPIEKAIQLIEAVAEHINEQLKRSEVGSKLMNYPELVAPHRYLMWEGNIETRFEKEKEEAKFVLFNDMLLHYPAKKITKGSKWHLQPENSASIQLVWTAAASINVTNTSSSAIGPLETIDLIMPAKRFTVVATTVEDRTFLKSLREALQRHFGVERPPAERECDHQFSDEASYSGQWRDGKMHGQGIMNYKGISTYSGRWENGFKQGQGSMAWMSGNTYDGQWMNDLPHGEGVFVWPNHDTYTGSFSEGQKNGKGIFTWASGATYNGEWSKDKPSGNGTYESETESYTGGWLDGVFHGNGVLTEHVTGRSYDGGWVNGIREGTGTMNYGNGSEYSGNWKKNRRDGKGKLTSTIGNETECYTGDWSDDRKNGVGVWTATDGSVYEGTFKDDQRHGKGKLKFADNDPGIRLRYEGEFENDKMSGKGTLWFKNGDMYDGGFKDNVFHGQGSYQYMSSIKVEGKFASGLLEGKGGVYQQVNASDKKPTHIAGSFHHGQFSRSKDSTTKFEIPVAPVSTVINIGRL